MASERLEIVFKMDDKDSPVKSYIALGSNIGDSIANVQEAVKRISAKYKLCTSSSLYLTKPWGYLDQADFINSVILIETKLSAQQLLQDLQTIEIDMGRERVIHWGPRLIDLDILTYNDEKIDEANLKIPHPFMMERAFVLAPLCEIDNKYLEAYNSLSSDLRTQIQRL
jgi:2-amino-4-hydroxy-6-hydroxymethyldihydropteridine diphosphokinase